MWPNFFTGFPFLFPTIGRANFNTLPTVAVTVGTENVTLELPNSFHDEYLFSLLFKM